ncbi:MAG: hypothetical protein QME55_00460 [Brevundimonas sp.]|uniref:hypothetical protein n=1 Tax=Brevundimonas sp. TaxID=1871086 RepID=UPI00260849DF|nr:hypothetical protein [Brevundimonas sp.]MDI6623174.1 hypothetical protein [Brevundimonas sp.]MDQ7811205.1 hypothetical protein [Brevundimonas sp.]
MRPRLNFSPRQSRAARALLDWDAARLAQLAGLEVEAVELFEAGEGDLSAAEHEALCTAIYGDGWGVIAIQECDGGEGVRFAKPRAMAAMLLDRLGLRPSASAVEGRGRGDW